jgi:hypothetical protein
MRFEVLLEELLNELSGKEIYQKYYSKIPFDDFLTIVTADPQTIYEGGEIKRMGKYSKLLVALYQKGGIRLDDADKAKEYLGYVYTHKIPLDVNKIKQLGDLYEVVKGYIVQDTKSLEEILKILPKDEYKVLHNGDRWYILQPLTEKASCYLGVNTEWCTTWGPYSLDKRYKDRGNHFTSHSTKGPLFIMINKSDTSDKYQFHFETNQFMDKNDKRIDTASFLQQRDKQEILQYFFPSLFQDVTPEQMKLELKKMDVLPNELGLKIFEKSIGKINNPLVNALLKKEEDVVESLIQGVSNINISQGTLSFDVKDIQNDVEQLEQNMGWYEYETDHGWEYVYDDVRDRGMDDYEREKLQEFLSGYYEENKDEFRNTFSVKDFQEFIKNFFDNFVSNDDIQEAFWSDIADLSYASYEQANQVTLDNIRKDIDISSNYNSGGGYEITLGLVKFIQFLLKKDISEIPDEDILDDTLDAYVSYCGHDGEYERTYDYNLTYPKYGSNTYLSSKTDKYFDSLFDDVETSGECIQLRKKFNDIVEKYFKGSTTYQNEHIRVKLKSNEIDCNTGMVKVEYDNLDTGETFGGWRDKNDGVKIDNLVSLMTNYKLFESIIKFKKNIIK